MLKNYKELQVWQKAYQQRLVILSSDLGYIKAEDIEKLQENMGAIERMLKGLIKSLENKHLNP